MKIGRCKLLSLISYIIFMTIVTIILNNTNDFITLSIIVVSNFIFQIFIFLKNGYNLFSFAPIFILLGQIFEFGVTILYSINYDFSSYVLYQLGRVDDGSLFEAASYAFYCIAATFLGNLIFYNKSRLDVQANGDINDAESSTFYLRTGWLFLLVFGFLWGGIQVYNFTLSQYGYLTNVYNSIPSTLLTLGNFMYVGLFFLMVSSKLKGKKSRAKKFFILSILLAGISMLAGVRSMGMCIIVLLMIYYNAYIQKFDRKQVILFVLCGYILLATLTAIMHVRSIGFSIDGFLEEWVKCITSDVIFKSLEEFGLTIFVLAHEVSIYNDGGFIHNYLGIFTHEFLVSIPGITYIYPSIAQEGYDLLGLRALGSSYIADFYYYLGYAGVGFAMLWGGFLGFIDYLLNKMNLHQNYYKAGTFFVFYILILSEIRSPFRFGYKVLLLSIMLMYCTKFFFKRIKV